MSLIHCEKSLRKPVHPSSLSCLTNLNLADDTVPKVELIVPVALNNLSIDKVTAQAKNPFPSLANIKFLTLSATVNDTLGGYTNFTIGKETATKTAESQTPLILELASSMTRWVPNLTAGTYKITAVPCNSLGCREDLAVTTYYSQPENIYSDPVFQKKINDKMEECFLQFDDLYRYANQLVNVYAPNIADQLASSKSTLRLATSSNSSNQSANCISQDQAASDGQNAMHNIHTIGVPYVGEMISNPDISNIITQQFQMLLNSRTNTTTSTSTVTVTASSTSTASSVSTTSTATASSVSETSQNRTLVRNLMLSFGIISIASGAMSLAYGTSKIEGWDNLVGGRVKDAINIKKALLSRGYDSKTAVEVLNKSLNIADDLKILVKQQLALENNEGPIKDYETAIRDQNFATFKSDQEKIVLKRAMAKTTFVRGALIGAGLIGVGIAQVLISQILGLTANSNNANPLKEASDLIDKDIFATQKKFRQCTIELNDIVQANSPK